MVGLEDAEIRGFQDFLQARETGLLPHDKATVSSLRDHLRFVVGSLRILAGHVRATDEALDRVLGILGLRSRSLAVRQLGEVQELLGLVGRLDRVLRTWLDPERREEIRRVLEVFRTALPEFSASRTIGLDGKVLREFEGLLDGSPTILLPQGTGTVRALLDHLDRALLALRTIDRHFAETGEALDRVLTVLGLTRRPLAVRGLRKVRELLDLIGGVEVIRRPWLDPQQRQEVRRILDLFQRRPARVQRAEGARARSRGDPSIRRISSKAIRRSCRWAGNRPSSASATAWISRSPPCGQRSTTSVRPSRS